MYPDPKDLRLNLPHDPDFISLPRSELMVLLADDATNKHRLNLAADEANGLRALIDEAKSESAELQKLHGAEMDKLRETLRVSEGQLNEARGALANALSMSATFKDQLRSSQWDNIDLNRRNEILHAEIQTLKRKRLNRRRRA